MITTVQASIAKTTAFTTTPDIDISGMKKGWELHLEITELKADAPDVPTVRFTFSDSVNDFVASLHGPHAEFAGNITTAAPVEKVFQSKDYPAMRFGTTSADLRLDLDAITGTNASCTYHAWIVSND